MEGTHTMPETITPAVPPTPPVPLAALLAREDLALRQIAGPDDPSVVIHWAHTSEMADPYPYLLGGELLLTAGVHVPEAAGSGTYFDDYVSRIVAAGGAALGFGLAPVHDTVPRALVAACERYGLPLLEVPPQTTFSGVARAVWQLMAQARLAELRRVAEAQQGLASAAARPDPVPAVMRRLAHHLSGHAVLYGPDGTSLATAGRAPADEVRNALAELATVVRPTPAPSPEANGTPPPAPHTTPDGTARGGGEGTAGSGGVAAPVSTSVGRPLPTSAAHTVGATHLAVYALGTGDGFVLGVAATRREPGDNTIASVAAVLLSLLTGEHHSGAGAARSSALVRLLLGAPPEAVAPLLGKGGWVVVHARPEGQLPDAVGASALGAALGSPLLDLGHDIVRVLVPGGRAPEPQAGWTLGVSGAVEPREWAAGDAQAARALARARATRTPLVRHSARPGLEDLVPRADAEAHALAVLAPLAGRPELAETLRNWLALHGSWDRTAVALDVHRNTVRQRIARCAALLDADLDDPDVRMELWFALRHG